MFSQLDEILQEQKYFKYLQQKHFKEMQQNHSMQMNVFRSQSITDVNMMLFLRIYQVLLFFYLIISILAANFVIRQTYEPHPLPNINVLPESIFCVDDPNIVDAVLLWVNGSDRQWISRMIEASSKFQKIEESYFQRRFTDHGELKYALRSIEKYAPWIHRIFIITDDQYPNWIQRDHPKLQFVSHQTLFYPGYHTFNSNTIQLSLYNIPGISRRFILMDDDFLFLDNVTISDFYGPNDITIQNPIIRNNDIFHSFLDTFYLCTCRNKHTTSIYHAGISRSHRFITHQFQSKILYDPPHVHVPMDMNLYFQLLGEPGIRDHLSLMPQFRMCSDLQIQSLYIGYSFVRKQSIRANPPQSSAIFKPKYIEQFLRKKKNPKLFCLNFYHDEFFNQYLPSQFPDKSSFEL